jgi:hypothetical protein
MSYNEPFKAALPCGVRDLFLEDAVLRVFAIRLAL